MKSSVASYISRGSRKQSYSWLLPHYNLSLQLSSTSKHLRMSTQRYPGGYWADHFHGVSKHKPAQDDGGGEAHGHTRPTQYNPQIYSTALYEVQNDADESSESRPVCCLEPG